MSDVWTMVWKEWRDSLFPGGRAESLRPLIFIGLLGLLWPLITGPKWLDLSTVFGIFTVWFPFIYILNYIGDAFAGERERHTLETLLASRISDRAILLGKVIATVGYVWGLTIFSSLLGALVTNLFRGSGPWTFYHPINVWLGALFLTLLACLLSASGGILVSLHSATVRQAQQTLLLSTMAVSVAIYLVARALPPSLIAGLSGPTILLIAMLVLAVLDAILLAISMASFHRSRLILS